MPLCCGAGAGVRASNPETALDLGSNRVDEAVATGAEILVSACPFCEYHIAASMKEEGVTIRVADLTEIVAEAMAEEEETAG